MTVVSEAVQQTLREWRNRYTYHVMTEELREDGRIITQAILGTTDDLDAWMPEQVRGRLA